MLKRFIKSSWKAVRTDVKSEKGTALLVALLVMGILTSVSMAVSALIVRELQVTRLAVNAGKAYYAAESGVEIALLQLESNLPGFERDDDEPAYGEDEFEAGFDWTIENLANEYPYLNSDDYDVTDAPASVYYGELALNESVTFPLFNPFRDVKKFVVAYYVDFTSEDLDIGGGLDLSSWDILRWKIYGLTKEEGGFVGGVTQSINDFTAVSTIIHDGNEFATNAGQPSWFGSVSPNDMGDWLHSEDVQYFNYYFKKTMFEQVTSTDDEGNSIVQDVYAGTCLPTEAREHYSYGTPDAGADVVHCYPIKKFLENHTYNYLTLTNLMNQSVFPGDWTEADRLEKSKLYYRIESFDAELPREYADITSVGESGESSITLNVLKKRDSYLPVFNFALYHTADKEEE